MGWRRRLLELAAAGGSLAACGTDAPHGPSFCGNVMPDPCICDRTPLDAGQCVAEAACRAAGGEWLFTNATWDPAPAVPDAPLGYWGKCAPIDAPWAPSPDAGVDAPVPDAVPSDAPHD